MPPRVVRIGRNNSTFQALSGLRTSRNRRHKTRTFLVEGVEPINSALRNGWPCNALIYESGGTLSAWAAGIVESTQAETRYEIAPDLLANLSAKSETSELL